MTCPDCGRPKRRPEYPPKASPALRAALKATASVCLWCRSVALLGGDFEPGCLMDGFTEAEKAEIRRLGAQRQAELIAEYELRKARRQTSSTKELKRA